MTWDQRDPDGPPAWWVARCHRASARRPLCDEYGTPEEASDEADSDGSDDDEPAPEGDSGDGSAP